MDVSIVVFSLFATFSGVYPRVFSIKSQLEAVCHGVSTIAIMRSPAVTGVPQRVPATEHTQKSHESIAPIRPEPPVDGKRLVEASYEPR